MTMNKPIRNIMFFALIMVIILMANLSIVHVFKEDEYANNPLNRRMFIKAKLQPRGQISAGGIVLAESKQEEENGFYHREYPNYSQQFGIVTGYLSDVYGSNGIESSYNDILSGTANSPKLWWKKLISNEKVVGNVELTLIPSVQQAAYSKMSDAGYEGAVVAIKPSTGEVLAMASTPSYDSAKIADENTAEQAWKQYTEDEGSPLLNHATQDILPPGSTFKVITPPASHKPPCRAPPPHWKTMVAKPAPDPTRYHCSQPFNTRATPPLCKCPSTWVPTSCVPPPLHSGWRNNTTWDSPCPRARSAPSPTMLPSANPPLVSATCL